MNFTRTITIAYGDGFGPHVMESALTVLREAGANLTIETIEIGSRIYSMGSKTGILPLAWKVLEKNRVLLKAPVIVPQDCRETGEVIREYFGLADIVIPAQAVISTSTSEAVEREIPACAGMTNSFVNKNFAMFEPTYASECWEKKPATLSPEPMLRAAIDMLNHIGQQDTADKIATALHKGLEENLHIKQRKRLARITEAVIERL